MLLFCRATLGPRPCLGLIEYIICHLLIFALHTTGRSHDASFTPDAVLRVTQQVVSIGGIKRLTTLVNGSVPGPELRILENQVTWIRVYNDLPDQNLTMHWHGLAQAAAPFSDGTPLASQWAVPPAHFFDYELAVPYGSAGTYFYHSHVGFQAVSASGPLIIEDRYQQFKTDGDRILHLQELFNSTDASIEDGLQATPMRWSGETNGLMINGHTISNYAANDSSSMQLSVIHVDPNRVYRMRFIGAVSLSYTAIGIEHHPDLQIIEADGAYTQPYTTSFLQVASGQRFSTLLTTMSCDQLKQLGRLDFYIQIETRERPANVTNYAILRYQNTCLNFSGAATNMSTTKSPITKPVQLPSTVNGFLDYSLRPLHPNNFPTASDVTRRVIINVQQVFNKWIVWRDSNVTWTDNATDSPPHTTPSQPYLVSLYQDQAAYMPSYAAAVKNNGVDPATGVFPAKIGEVLEIVLQNIGAETYDGSPAGGLDVHPFHAHGSHYYDIGGGPGAYDPKVAEARLKGTQPVLRDTTMLFRYNKTVAANAKQGWRAWRLRVEQPGVWMIHCHTLQHMLMGMQTVWVFGDSHQLMALPKPEVQGYLTFGGDAYGNQSHAPQVVHFSDLNG